MSGSSVLSFPRFALPRPDRWIHRQQSGKLTHAIPPAINSLISARYGRVVKDAGKPIGNAGRSDTWLIAMGSGPALLKRYKSSLDRQQIIYEHSILKYLEQNGFPAPRLIRALEGETYVEADSGLYAIFEYLPGYYQFHNNIYLPGQVRSFITSAAQTLAMLHLTLRDFQPAGRHPNGFESAQGSRWHPVQANVDQLESLLRTQSQPALSRISTRLPQVRQLIARLVELDEDLDQDQPLRLIIHGDYGPYNLFFKHDHPTVVLDFELARLDWRLIDLATSWMTFTRNRFGFDPKKMQHFIDAYSEVFPISTKERRLLPDVWQFINLRRLAVCLYQTAAQNTQAYLKEIQMRFDLCDWIDSHRKDLDVIVNSRGIL